MSKRSIKKIHPAVRDDIADLTTRRALPTNFVEHIDPFLFLNHHGPQVYPQNNHGLPFGPHPHRGFETVTFILEGDIAHKDSGGHESVINAGGIQWMTAGRGLVHSEESSEEFKRQGGQLEILQLWLNLPSRLKMTTPKYIGLQRNDIPLLNVTDKVSVELISGKWEDNQGAVTPLIDVHLMLINIKSQGDVTLRVASERNIFFYLIRGEVNVNGESMKAFHLMEFNHDGDTLEVSASSDSIILYGHAEPLNEPIVSYGPFVMNTKEEIHEAIRDYQAGKFN